MGSNNAKSTQKLVQTCAILSQLQKSNLLRRKSYQTLIKGCTFFQVINIWTYLHVFVTCLDRRQWKIKKGQFLLCLHSRRGGDYPPNSFLQIKKLMTHDFMTDTDMKGTRQVVITHRSIVSLELPLLVLLGQRVIFCPTQTHSEYYS